MSLAVAPSLWGSRRTVAVRTICAMALSSAVAFAADEYSTVTLSPRGCQIYASWSGNLVWASTLGADKEKAQADLRLRDEKTPNSIFALMLRNLDALWTTSAEWEQVTVVILQDCIMRRGVYAGE